MELICIVCPIGCKLSTKQCEGEISVSGNICPKGKAFAETELTNPTRTVTTTIATTLSGYPVLPVRTNAEVPKSMVCKVCRRCGQILIEKPVKCGDIIITNVENTGADIVATRTVDDSRKSE